MADKTLNDVVKSLKSIDTTLKKPAVQTASDKEASEEAARDAKESKQIQKDILATLRGAHGAASGADKKKGGLIAGLLGGIGAGFGSIAKGISNNLAKISPTLIPPFAIQTTWLNFQPSSYILIARSSVFL